MMDKDREFADYRTKENIKNSNIGIQFFKCIKDGINPVTGEVLSSDSAWSDPKILEDLETYIGRSEYGRRKIQKNILNEVNKLGAHERPIIAELMQQIKELLPNISDKNAELMRFYYEKSGQKKSLQETADEFNITRERVRQIRNNNIKNLEAAIRNRKFIFGEQNSNELSKSSKQAAIMYLNEILDSISSIGSVKSYDDILKAETANFPTRDFFQIEKCSSFTLFDNRSKFYGQEFTVDMINERRLENSTTGKLLNFGFPITWEEVREMKRRVDLGHNTNQLEQYFQRSHTSIYQSLEKLSIKDQDTKSPDAKSHADQREIIEAKKTKFDTWEYLKKFTDQQVLILKEIYSSYEGVGLNEICKCLNLLPSQLQDMLEDIELRWRAIDSRNDKLWILREGRYFPLPAEAKETSTSEQNIPNENLPENEETVYCSRCEEPINPLRLKRVPNTRFCTECAAKIPIEKRHLLEPFGTREDFKKDRSSWKETNS